LRTLIDYWCQGDRKVRQYHTKWLRGDGQKNNSWWVSPGERERALRIKLGGDSRCGKTLTIHKPGHEGSRRLSFLVGGGGNSLVREEEGLEKERDKGGCIPTAIIPRSKSAFRGPKEKNSPSTRQCNLRNKRGGIPEGKEQWPKKPGATVPVFYARNSR